MSPNVVIDRLKEAQHDVKKLPPEVIIQIASALVSNSKNLRDKITISDVAKYYDTSSETVSACIETAMRKGLIRFSTAQAILMRLDENQRRHFHFNGGLSTSATNQLSLLRNRFQYFESQFDSIPSYDKAYKTYLGNTTLKVTINLYGFSKSELTYLLIRKACTVMISQEYKSFQTKFMKDFIGEISYFALADFVDSFRARHSYLIDQLDNSNIDKRPIKNQLTQEFLKEFDLKWY